MSTTDAQQSVLGKRKQSSFEFTSCCFGHLLQPTEFPDIRQERKVKRPKTCQEVYRPLFFFFACYTVDFYLDDIFWANPEECCLAVGLRSVACHSSSW